MITASDIEYGGKVLPKFLLVDDKPENLVALEKVLKGLRVELVKATSGNDALKLMLNNEFALALLDVQMPEMDGYELAELMRTDQRTSMIPIIFISAIYTDKLNIFKGYEKGAFSFITKPFKPQELLNKIDFFIDKYHAEKAYEDSRKKYMDLYNNSPDMLLSIDLETATIKECNDTLLKNTGYSRRELIGESIFNLYGSSSVEKAQKALQQFSSGVEKIRNLELTLVGKDNREFDVLFNATGLTDIHGKYITSNSSLRDISELKKAQKQLEKTLEQLQRSNQELEDFVYLTSHDLQEPMLTVLSFIGLLEEEFSGELNHEAVNYIQYSLLAANRMKELITGLLNYLRAGTGYESEQVDLNAIINELQEEMKGSIGKNNAQISVTKLPLVQFNKKEAKHLLQNLISNAIKFRRPNVTPEIKISAEKNGKNWVFSVADNGIGIENKNYGKVFQIFKQLHERGRYEGVGIGMAICKKIVEIGGGRLWVESDGKTGSTFYFTLPV